MSTLQVANLVFESTANNRIQYIGSNTITISTAGNEDVRIDASGNVGIGTNNTTTGYKLNISGNNGLIISAGDNQFPVGLYIMPSTHATSRRSTMVMDNWSWGQDLSGNGSKNLYLYDAAGNATRMFVSASGGLFNIGHTSGDYAMLDVRRGDSASANPTSYMLRESNTGAQVLITKQSTASFGTTVQLLYTTRSQSTAHQFILCSSNADATPDTEFYVRGDGATFADGAYTGTGADYAEFFEWLDGNPNNEDRRGISVVLENGKIKPASNTDTNIIGVISANPTVVGDASWSSWQGKYLRDEYGSPVMEDCEVWEWTSYEETIDPNGNPTTKEKSHSYYADNVPAGIFIPEDKTVTIQERWKLNPDFDPNVPYVNRADRKEWSTVGLMGKLRVRKGQPVGDRWIKLKDVTETVEEWLVR